MTNKIWYKMIDIKFGEIYLSKYLSRQRSFKKCFQVITLIVSFSGILSWSYFEKYVWVAFVLIAVMQLILLVENQIIRSDKEIEEISNLRMMYTRYFNKLEPLWNKTQYKQIGDNKAMEKYFTFQKKEWLKIEELDCKLDIKRHKKMENKTEIETNNYLNKYHING
jgi:hypothetical protein